MKIVRQCMCIIVFMHYFIIGKALIVHRWSARLYDHCETRRFTLLSQTACLFILLLSAFSHQGSPQRIFHLQLLLSSVSSSVILTSAMSSFTTSINLLFGLPRFLFPGNSILSILLPIYPSSFLSTCPYHLVWTLVFSLQTVPPVLSL